jgi:hypothetical protein
MLLAEKGQVYHLAISATDDADIVAAIVTNKIRVLSLQLIAETAVTLTWTSGTGPTTISGPQAIDAKGGIVLPHNPFGWFETAAGAKLSLAMSAAANVGGSITYQVVV